MTVTALGMGQNPIPSEPSDGHFDEGESTKNF